ncbi:MFS transporter [Actinomycetospora atypica]|uniref:MFS transporter n=1 Tax=Actinomycetospora atypica TaxID=1290095 RepID=A0ABV9YR83_9PSEU
MQQCQVETEGPVGTAVERVGAVRLTTVGMALIAVCYGLARFAYGLFVPSLRAEFNLDATSVGAIASGSYIGYCVAVVLATVATTRWGARTVGVAAGATAAVGTGLVALAPSTPVLVVGVVLAGSSTGLASPPMAQAVATHLSPARQSRSQSVVNAGTGFGVLVSGPVALLAAGGQWRLAWAAFSLAAVAVTVWLARTVPSGGPAAATTGRVALAEVLPPGSGRLLLAAAVTGIGSAAVWTYGRELVSAAGLGDVTASVLWIVLGAAGLLGAFAGDLTTRLGPARSWSAAMLLLAAATVALALAPGQVVVAVLAFAVFGAVYIALSGFLLLWGTRVNPDRPALGVGAGFLLLALGQAVGAPLLGAVADALGTPQAFLLAAGITVLGALVRPRTQPRTERSSAVAGGGPGDQI